MREGMERAVNRPLYTYGAVKFKAFLQAQLGLEARAL